VNVKGFFDRDPITSRIVSRDAATSKRSAIAEPGYAETQAFLRH
jgi:hypothetical protein